MPSFWKRLTLVAALAVGAAPALAGRDVKLEELPAPARNTIERETRDATITGIEEDTENGKPVYEVEYTKDQQRWELDVTPDGAIIENRLD